LIRKPIHESGSHLSGSSPPLPHDERLAPASPSEASGSIADPKRSSGSGDLRSILRRDLDQAKESAEHIEPDEGERPTDAAFRAASFFIDLLPPKLPRPAVWASGDGEVGFTWSKRTGAAGFLEVAFKDTACLEWAADFGEGCRGGTVTIDLTRVTRLPTELQDKIDRLTSEPSRADE